MTLKRLLISTIFVIYSAIVFSQNYQNIQFVENKGQWDSRVKFKGEVSNGMFMIRENGVTIVQSNDADLANLAEVIHNRPGGEQEKVRIRSHVWNIDFINASPQARLIAEKPLNTYNNYFVGNDPSRWAGECRIFQAISMEEIYPNINARYYTDNGVLKYDIIVKPGGDVSKIALKYDGVNNLQAKKRELVVTTSLGEFKESNPLTYQPGLSARKEINCKYIVDGNIVRFDVDDYDPNEILVIDPSIIFCSFSGSSADNWGFTATYGPDGSMYAGGIVWGANNYPTNPGAYDNTYNGGEYDIGVIKLTPDGSNRVYATYIGGNREEQPHSLIVDNQGNLVIAGRTNSGSSYPTANPTGAGSEIGTLGSYDIIVTKLNAAGSGLIGSKRIGGVGNDGVNITPTRQGGINSIMRNYGDDGRSEVILDNAGNIYVASCTQSNDFPRTPGAFQTTLGGNQDGVLLKFTPDLGSLVFASYLGGLGNDAAYVLSLAPNGDIYVGGGTESQNMFPGSATAGTIGSSHHNPSGINPIDGFVAIVSNDGSILRKGTYIGTSGIDQVFGLKFDNSGFPYVMGQTTGSWVPVNATYSNSGGKQFIAKLQPDLSAFVYSTMFGSGAANPNISPVAFLVDRCENVYISGWGGFFNDNIYNTAGTTGLPITPDAFKSSTDGNDFYFFVLEKNATGQLFGSFFGENNTTNGGTDHVDGGTSRFDENGVIYQAICGNCKLSAPPPYPSFPVTAGSWSTTNNTSNGCNLTMLKIAMNLAGVAAGVQSAIDGVVRDTAGCVPLTVDFSDTLANGQSYEWYFNYVPGNAPDLVTNTPNAQHTYTAVGTYNIMLVAVDPNTCNERDSSFMNIKVGATQALPVFTATRLQPCEDFRYQFTNTTIEPALHPFSDTTFIWDFGDGSPTIRTNGQPVTHQYSGPGSYIVRLTLNDSTYCNSPDVFELTVVVTLNVRAGIDVPPIVCVGQPVQFGDGSVGAATYQWNFGDGQSSTDAAPIHTYTIPGTYTVTQSVFNPGSCNGQDMTSIDVTVLESPLAQATFAPDPPAVNTPTTFANLSQNAVRYKWFFGDGDSLETTTLQSVQHQYNATGTFQAMLIAYNQLGCSDTTILEVSSLIEALVDVPNAFTPLSGDENSVILVRGFGISKMRFIIWNRWGQKVFETNNTKQGWDGRVRGAVQPMDVYAYTLDVEFFDGTKTTKKGDITLIR